MAYPFSKFTDSVRDIRTDAVAINDCMIVEIGKIGRGERLLGWLTLVGSVATATFTVLNNLALPWVPVAMAIGTAVVAGLTKSQARDREQKLPRLLAIAKNAGTVEIEAGSHIDMWSNNVSEGTFDLKAGIASRDLIKARLSDLKSEVAQLGCQPQYVKRDKTGTRKQNINSSSRTQLIYYTDAPFFTETSNQAVTVPTDKKSVIRVRRVE